MLFAGRMTSLKGGQVLVSAAAHASRLLGRPVNVIMAGDGPQKGAWRALARSLGVPLELTGWLTLDDRARVYARGMIAVMPSLWPEPFGLSGLDAAALGRPTIAFDVGGIREWLTDGVNGLLVAPRAGAEGLARAIASMLDSVRLNVREWGSAPSKYRAACHRQRTSNDSKPFCVEPQPDACSTGPS